MLIDELQILLNKYSPAILDPLIKAAKVFQFTIPPQIMMEEDTIGNSLTLYNFKVLIQTQNNKKYNLKFYLPVLHSASHLYDRAAEDAVKLSPILKYVVGANESLATPIAFLFLITLAYKQLAVDGYLHSSFGSILANDFNERDAFKVFSIKSSLDTYITVSWSIIEE